MNSTDPLDESEKTLNRDAVFWFGALSIIFGCIIELLLILFFCTSVFFTSKSNDLKSAYFFITVIGYIVDIISSGSALLTQLLDPGNVTVYSAISKFTVLYSDFHLGLLSALMGLNRCTALAFPFIHNKVSIKVLIFRDAGKFCRSREHCTKIDC